MREDSVYQLGRWANPTWEGTTWSEELTEMERPSVGAEGVWLCTAKTGTKNDESMQAREIGHERTWKDVKNESEDSNKERILPKKAKSMENGRAKKKVTIAKKENVGRQDEGLVKEYRRSKFFSSWLLEDVEGKEERESEREDEQGSQKRGT